MANSFIKLGPFIGGMNTASDPSSVEENELVDCVNFELDLDGSLVCRPPIVETTNNSGTTTERLVMIGRATLAGVNYVVASNTDGTYAFNGTSWVVVRTGLSARVALQFQDKLFVVATHASAQPGGYWTGAAWTDDVNMPRGEAAVFHKSRMFIVPGIDAPVDPTSHQIRFTDPISIALPVPLVWNAVNTIPVSPGDGQALVDIVVYNDNLLVFKQDSTYSLAYDVQVTDGILRNVNSKIGATSRRCVILYENSVFLYHEGNIYEVQNYDFARINVRVPFQYDSTDPATGDRVEDVFLSLLGDRLIVRYFNRIYVYGLRNKTWSRWESNSEFLHNFGPLVDMPFNPSIVSATVYYAGSTIDVHENVYKIANGFDDSTQEETLTEQFDIDCRILTKNYDMVDSAHFKRLMWWGADVLSARDVTAIVTPVILNFKATWDDLGAFTWDELAAFPWDKPLVSISNIQTDVVDTTYYLRKFIKFKKSLRFRQVNFQVMLKCNGLTSESPCRLFSLTTIVGIKQTVVKQVS